MGMQCHFNHDDLPEGTQISMHHDADSDTWTAIIHFLEGPIVVNASREVTSYWFDVGHGDKKQLLMIQNLIRNRVCFTCS